MRERGYGRVINIASAHGLVVCYCSSPDVTILLSHCLKQGSKNKAAYVTSKHGVIGFTKVVALEAAGTGVTANAICPGMN